jgi:hypothetical protein
MREVDEQRGKRMKMEDLTKICLFTFYHRRKALRAGLTICFRRRICVG